MPIVAAWQNEVTLHRDVVATDMPSEGHKFLTGQDVSAVTARDPLEGQNLNEPLPHKVGVVMLSKGQKLPAGHVVEVVSPVDGQ